MFLLKKCLARLFFPVPLCCEAIAVGMVLLWLSKRRRLGKCFTLLGLCLLLLFSNGLFSDLLLSSLEKQYPPLTDFAALESKAETPIRWVVVLGGGYAGDQTLPPSARLDGDSLSRFIEGVRIHKRLPESKLLISVGDHGEEVVEGAEKTAAFFGVRADEIVIVRGALDTRDEVGLVRKFIGGESFVLVTSASHLPRAMRLFQGGGMKPVPAPTDFWVRSRSGYENWFPTADSLKRSERACYEYLGLAWMRLSGG